MSKDHTIKHRTIITLPEAIIREREDGIVHVTFLEGTTFDIPLQERLMQEYIKLCQDQKRPFLFDAEDHFTLTKEASQNAKKLEPNFPATAHAAVVKNLAHKIIGDFFLKFHKPKLPFKIFRKQEDAIKWLRGHVNK